MNKAISILIFISLLLLSGCSINPKKTLNPAQSSIDWVDFVKLGSVQYSGLFSVVLLEPERVSEEAAGEVRFHVADNVTNPSYRIQSGDAAYLSKGTKLYQVEGYDPDELLAVESSTHPYGYKLYAAEDARAQFHTSYDNLDKQAIKHVYLYRDEQGMTVEVAALDAEESQTLTDILDAGVVQTSFTPSRSFGDPIYYELLIDTGEPIATSYSLVDDGLQIAFYSSATRIVDDSIRQWLN